MPPEPPPRDGLKTDPVGGAAIPPPATEVPDSPPPPSGLMPVVQVQVTGDPGQLQDFVTAYLGGFGLQVKGADEAALSAVGGGPEVPSQRIFVALVPNGPGDEWGDFWLGTFTDQAEAVEAAGKVRRPGATVHIIESVPGQGMVPVIIRRAEGDTDGT